MFTFAKLAWLVQLTRLKNATSCTFDLATSSSRGKQHHSVVIRFHWSCIVHTVVRRALRVALRNVDIGFPNSHIQCTDIACYSRVDCEFQDCGMRLSRQELSDKGVLRVSLSKPGSLSALQMTERWHFCTSPQRGGPFCPPCLCGWASLLCTRGCPP